MRLTKWLTPITPLTTFAQRPARLVSEFRIRNNTITSVTHCIKKPAYLVKRGELISIIQNSPRKCDAAVNPFPFQKTDVRNPLAMAIGGVSG